MYKSNIKIIYLNTLHNRREWLGIFSYKIERTLRKQFRILSMKLLYFLKRLCPGLPCNVYKEAVGGGGVVVEISAHSFQRCERSTWLARTKSASRSAETSGLTFGYSSSSRFSDLAVLTCQSQVGQSQH